MATAANKELVRQAFERWSAGTGGVFELLADDANWTIVGNSVLAGTYHGREAFLAAVIAPLNARLSTPLTPSVRGLYADGDMVIAYFDASAATRDGGRYANTYTWYLQMRDGAVVDAVAFFDSLALDEVWSRVPAGADAAASEG